MDFEALAKARADFDVLVADVRPQLLRYCARMTGSAVDGEDIVQEALAKVYFRLPQLGHVQNLRAWLFRVAHNKALDYLRRYDVRFGEAAGGRTASRRRTRRSTRRRWRSGAVAFRAADRAAAQLRDPEGRAAYSLEEISEILDASVPSIKGALHRAAPACDARLRRETRTPGRRCPRADDSSRALRRAFQRARLRALRAMLAEDVRLELVGMTEKSGAADGGSYFANYARLAGMRLEPGWWMAPAIPACARTAGRSPWYCLFVRFRDEGSS